MEKFSKELLASLISDQITFEDCDRHYLNDYEIEFDGCLAIVDAMAVGIERPNGFTYLWYIDVYGVQLLFDDGDKNEFELDELKEIERLVKLWN